MTLQTRLYTWFHGALAGSDSQGNRYYRGKHSRRDDGRRERRWVLYKGESEASKVPPEWHAWLHYLTDDVPTGDGRTQAWEQPHEPNLTGTAEAYRPPGHDYKGGTRARATGDYEPWTPSAS